MLTTNYPFQKISVIIKGFQLLKPNCHFSESHTQKVMVPLDNKGTILLLII